ncbi:MAG TPA: ferritin-like domain-containing protein [Terracidiphilus sp.]|nr:ferritin-like domain-containing protein [Terracidiphilus sp.]
MKTLKSSSTIELIDPVRSGRRRFLTQAGVLGIGAAAGAFVLSNPRSARADATSSAMSAQQQAQSMDTVQEIFTAALIAEDLATTFYYNGLVGTVIEDPNLAGPGGSVNNISSMGNAGNVNYLQAALSEEISHANLFRSLLGISGPSQDPVQTFYFPSGAFDSLSAFTGLLDALENAFIGAYLNAIQEFAAKSANRQGNNGGSLNGSDSHYSATELDYFAKVAASIMGIEAEHRVLGRVISNTNPANNLAYEQLDGLNAVYNGPKSAVAALTPFLTPSTGPGFSLATALANQGSVSLPVTGNPPAA